MSIPLQPATIAPQGGATRNNPGQPLVTASNLRKIYGSGEAAVIAVDDISLTLQPGEFTAITGPSGCGKSTLLHLLVGLDRPDSGTVNIAGVDVTALPDATEFRRSNIGFIFQAFNLIPTLTAQENIVLPLRLAGDHADQQWLTQVVQMLGIADRLDHRPGQLSGGQIQRVAIARALVSRPQLIVADEPTGNLDSRASADVLAILRAAVSEYGQTVLMVTHDRHAAAQCDRVITLKDGRISADLDHPTVAALSEVM